MTPNQKLIMQIENDILTLVDEQENYTRSDLQGRAMAIAMQAVTKAQKQITRDDWESIGNKNDWGLIR